MNRNIIRIVLFALMLFTLASCGGGSGSGDKVTDSFCTLPVEIILSKEPGTNVVRKDIYADGSTQVFVEPSAFAGIYDCNIAGDQHVSFNLTSKNWFTSVGDHIAILMKATENLSVPMYEDRGFIIHNNWGILGEYFYRNANVGKSVCQKSISTEVNYTLCPTDGSSIRSSSLKFYDNTIYEISATATQDNITYNASDISEHISSSWSNDKSQVLSGGKIIFVFLCKNDQCSENFQVKISKLNNLRKYTSIDSFK